MVVYLENSAFFTIGSQERNNREGRVIFSLVIGKKLPAIALAVGIAAGSTLIGGKFQSLTAGVDIGRGQRNLAAAAGRVQGKGRYCHA